ncbi:MAG: hypothetical protein ACP5UA_07015 [Candidatus Hydrogenedens sp.]
MDRIKHYKLFLLFLLILSLIGVYFVVRKNISENIKLRGYIRVKDTDIENMGVRKETFKEIVTLVREITNTKDFYKMISMPMKLDLNEPSERTYHAKGKDCIKIYFFILPPKNNGYYSLSEEPYIEILFDKDIGKIIYMCDYTDFYRKISLSEDSNREDENGYKTLINLLLNYYGYSQEPLEYFQVETRKMAGKVKITMKLRENSEEGNNAKLTKTFYIIFNSRFNKIQYFDVFTLNYGNTVLWSYSPDAKYYENSPLMLQIKSLIDN